MVQKIRVWLFDPQTLLAAFGWMAVGWGGGHLLQGEALGHTFGVLTKLFTREEVEVAFVVVGLIQLAGWSTGNLRLQGWASLLSFVVNCEVVSSVVVSGTFPIAAATLFAGGMVAAAYVMSSTLFTPRAGWA